MGKGTVVTPFAGVFLAVVIGYVVNNSTTNAVVIEIYGESFLAYLVGLVHATLLVSDLVYFFFPWLLASLLMGYISRAVLKGGLGSAFMIPAALLTFMIMGFIYNPLGFDVFLSEFIVLITTNLQWFVIGISSCGILGAVVGKIRKEPEILSSQFSNDGRDLVRRKCPNCGITYLSNAMYCRQCGINMDQQKKEGK